MAEPPELQKRSVVRYSGMHGYDVTLPPCDGLNHGSGCECGSRDSIMEVRYANSNYIKTEFIWRCADCLFPFECECVHLR